VLHRVADYAAWARAFFADPRLRAAMDRGGVVGAPRIEYFE